MLNAFNQLNQAALYAPNNLSAARMAMIIPMAISLPLDAEVT